MDARHRRVNISIPMFLSLLLALTSVSVALHLPGLFKYLRFIAALLLLMFPTKPGSASFNSKVIRFESGVFIIFTLLWSYILRLCTLNCGVPLNSVTEITAKVVQDSSFTEKGKHIMTVRLLSVQTKSGVITDAKGLIQVIGKTRAIITSGTRITLQGRFSGNFFFYDSLLVTKRNFVNYLRERLILFIENRVASQTDPASMLSILLLLGRSEDSGTDISRKAAYCGCSHVLALSGMHLNVLTGIFKFSKVLSTCVVLLFVFIAGPRASLLRATLMYFLSFLPVEKRITCSLLIQSVLFPYSIANTGCAYSYISIGALVVLAPVISYCFSLISGRKAGNLIGTQLTVILVNTPLTLYLNGQWFPSVFIAGPVSGFLIGISMIIGILTLIFGRLETLVKANGYVYGLIEKLFDKCGSFPSLHFKAYLILLVCCLLFCLACILKKTVKH